MLQNQSVGLKVKIYPAAIGLSEIKLSVTLSVVQQSFPISPGEHLTANEARNRKDVK